MTATRTTCPYCGVGCGVLVSADGQVSGDPEHPANFGRLCSKGAALGQTIDLDGRLLGPQIDGTAVSWDQALRLTARKFSQAIKTYGPDSVAFYVSGQLLTEDYYVANKLMKGFIGSANIDTNSRLCMASSVVGHKRAFGTDTVPGIYEDLEEADLVVLVGSNLAWCHPVLHQRLAAAKAIRPNLKIVNIDPRRTATSELADLHLSVAPDGDIALFNGLLAHIVDTGLADNAYIKNSVNGCFAAVEAARQTDPLKSGLTRQELQNFYQLWATTQKVVTVYSQGVNQSSCGSDKVNAIINCHLATGRIGKSGCGPLSVTGQPNAMGGREVGGLANMLANHLDIENEDHRNAVQTFWESPTICTSAGLKAVDLFEACGNGKIKALWIMSTNPAVSMPDSEAVSSAIGKVPFVAVSDIMARTDTGDLANVLLPATGWGEKNGTVTNSERRVSRQRSFLPAPEEARPDWQIICDVARFMGWANHFEYGSPAEIFAEYIALGRATHKFGKDLDLTEFEGVDYENLRPTQWPRNEHRFFADGKFYHADGRARMVPVAPATLNSAQRLLLNTGRNRDQWHTMTRTGKATNLGPHLAEPYLEIHPEDASENSLDAGDIAAVDSPFGAVLLRTLPTKRTPKGQVFAPMHWTRQKTRKGMVNSVTAPRTDPFSGQPALKRTEITVSKYQASWFGFALSTTEMVPLFAYSAVSRCENGWQMEMADTTAPKDWIDTATKLTGMAGAEFAVLTDAHTGAVRIAFTRQQRVRALFFAAREPVRLARSQLVSLLGQPIDALRALAGSPAQGHPDPGPTVCACFNVGRNTLHEAIGTGANTVETLGEKTCAGTNCGSCKPELAALIQACTLPLAAE